MPFRQENIGLATHCQAGGIRAPPPCKPRANALLGEGLRSFTFTEKSIRSSLLLALVLTEQEMPSNRVALTCFSQQRHSKQGQLSSERAGHSPQGT